MITYRYGVVTPLGHLIDGVYAKSEQDAIGAWCWWQWERETGRIGGSLPMDIWGRLIDDYAKTGNRVVKLKIETSENVTVTRDFNL